MYAFNDFAMEVSWLLDLHCRLDIDMGEHGVNSRQDALNSESWSRATLHHSRLPQSAILFILLPPTRRVLSSATEGKFSHGIDGHVQGVHGHVPCVSGVQGVPARLEGGVQPCCIQTRGLQEAARLSELLTHNITIVHCTIKQ